MKYLHIMCRSNLDGPSSGERNKIRTQRVTLRSILIGLSLAVFISVWIPYNIWILKSSAMDFEHLSGGVMIPFLFIVIVVNGCLRRVSPAAVLTASELIVIISIAMIASTVPSGWFYDRPWRGNRWGLLYDFSGLDD